MMLTELLYCTSIQIRCDRPLDNFCMIFAKLIVEKKLRHEYSVTCSTSSLCSSPFGSVMVLIMVWRAGRGRLSSGRMGCGFLAKLTRQYRKKLDQLLATQPPIHLKIATYLFSGESAFETTEAETSWRPNIFKIRSRQLVSSRCCPRWWNFMTSVN